MKDSVFGVMRLLPDSGHEECGLPAAAEGYAVLDDPMHGLILRIGAGTSWESFLCPKTESKVFFWGRPASRSLSGKRMLGWCLDVLDRRSFRELKQLLGDFLILRIDPNSRSITFVSDYLGIKPLYIGMKGQTLIFGSDVRQIANAGLASGSVDYDAVASWIQLGYPCNGGSLLGDYRRLAPASVTTVSCDGSRTDSYWSPQGQEAARSKREAAERITASVTASLRAMTRETEALTVLLTGGYDSRFLAGILSRQKPCPRIESIVVNSTPDEGEVAERVATRLGLGLCVKEVPGAVWDIYDEPFHFTPDGFPITKNESFAAVLDRPGIPVVNGYLGDSLVRGSHDTINGKHEAETTDLPTAMADAHRFPRRNLLPEPVAGRIRDRTIAILARHVMDAEPSDHAFNYVDLRARQRHYISNNFQQHRELADAVLPFAAPDLIDLKLSSPQSFFDWETYELIFRMFVPEVADIPHHTRLRGIDRHDRSTSRYIRRWSRAVAWRLATRPRDLRLYGRSAAWLRMTAAAVGSVQLDNTVLLGYRLLLLEREARRLGLDLNWDHL